MSLEQTRIKNIQDKDYSFSEVSNRLFKVKFEFENNFIDIKKEWNKTKKKDFTAVDLFCGCGGISKGLELAGINVIAGLDFFKEAGETYRKNFNHKFIYGDITKNETKEELYKTIESKLNGKKLNLIAGGFPCQGFSMAGKRNVDDVRNKLYIQALEVVERLKPDYIFFENVKGLLSMDKGRVKAAILEDFRKIGYKIDVKLLNSVNFDVPQKRERIAFIGNRIDKKIYYPLPINSKETQKTTKDAIEDLINLKEDLSFNHIITKHSEEMIKKLAKVEEGKSLYNYGDAWKKCPWNEPSCTIKENHGGVNIHPKLPRVLTVRECARIQNFPDNFIFQGNKSKQLVQIGNAVPPNLAKAIGLVILKSYEE